MPDIGHYSDTAPQVILFPFVLGSFGHVLIAPIKSPLYALFVDVRLVEQSCAHVHLGLPALYVRALQLVVEFRSAQYVSVVVALLRFLWTCDNACFGSLAYTWFSCLVTKRNRAV